LAVWHQQVEHPLLGEQRSKSISNKLSFTGH